MRLRKVELLYQLWSVNVVMILPAAVCIGVALPFDQVLLLSPPAVISLVQNGLDLIFLLSINDIWGRLKKVCAVFRGFSVG
jgi:hypothetical protein